jgi:glycosyltransferase involved in cell wall biosynthesis
MQHVLPSTLPLLQNRCDRLKLCVIIPTYNNDATLARVIQEVQQFTSNIIVVNDGSTDSTAAILTGFPALAQVSYPTNVGKGWALRQGFALAQRSGYDYAITIDSDGQHFAADLPAFLDKLEAEGSALLIGARNMTQDGIPGKSSFGHKFSNFWFWFETGQRLPDTQSGYRLYPLHALRGKRFFTPKYEFEIEVLVRAAWAGVPVGSVPIAVYYAPGKERITHFRPFQDFSRISVLNTILVIITLLYIKPKHLLASLFRRETYARLLAQVFNAEESAQHRALSVALGVFMGIAPLWGFQLVVAIALAVFLRLNRYLVILSANISLPPMIPLLIYLSYLAGGLVVPQPVQLASAQGLTLASIHQNFMQYFVGSWLLASGAALVAGGATYAATQLAGPRRKRLVTAHG